MKTLILISSLILSFNIFASEKGKDFNKAMMEDVKEDLLKHDDTYHKYPTRARGPASVNEEDTKGKRLEDQMNQDKKIEKMNFKQIGPNNW